MKHAWILNHYALEPGEPGGTRHYFLAANLPACGWKASILAASVEHPSGRQRLARKEKWRLDEIREIPYLWVRTPAYKGNGGMRMLNMLAYAARVLIRSTTSRLSPPDLIIGSSVHPFAAVAGLILARRHRVPFIFEVRDLWPQTLIAMGRIKENSLSARLLSLIEYRLYCNASRIVVLLPRAADYITPLGIPEDKVVWVPNGVDLSNFPFSEPPSRPSGRFELMYFGAHGQANALHDVLGAMKIVSDRIAPDAVHLRLIGDGPAKPGLIELARKLNLRNVSFEPPVPKSEVPSLAAEADAFIISVLDLPELYRYGISPNKLFDYLAAARPVIIASNAVNNPVRDAGAGLCAPAAEPAMLAERIIALASMPRKELHAMGRAGREHVEKHYGFAGLARRLAAAMNACIDSSAAVESAPLKGINMDRGA